jgi:hypothetical protein
MEQNKLLDLPSAEAAVRSALLSDIALLREQRKSHEERVAKLEAQVRSARQGDVWDLCGIMHVATIDWELLQVLYCSYLRDVLIGN